MATLAPLGYWREFDDNGDPLAGGKVYFYEAGTNTPKDTFVDANETATNTNPVILDANGFANVWLGEGAYKIVTTDANDVTIATRDDITGESSSAFGSSVIDVSSNLNITNVYNNNLLVCTNTITLTLLDANSAGQGFYFTVRNDGAGIITIDPDGSETIDGGATLDIVAGNSATIISDGDEWYSLFLAPTTGTAALEDIGTSGATVPLLNGNNTHSGSNSFSGAFDTTTTATTRETYSYSTETDAGTSATRHRERWFANNASGTPREVLLIDTYYDDATDGSEDTQARFWNYLVGTQRTVATWGAGLTLSNATGGDQGDGVLNAKGVRVNGSELQTATAWVNFNGTGTVAIRDSFNVSSITDNGTGHYTINFTNAMPNANYVVAGSAKRADNFQNATVTLGGSLTTNQSTTSVDIFTVEGANGKLDCTQVHVVIFGGN